MYKSWKWLWPFIAPYKKKLAFALFFGFLLAQFSIFLPIIGNTIILAFQKKTLLDDPNFYKFIDYFHFNKKPLVISNQSQTTDFPDDINSSNLLPHVWNHSLSSLFFD